MNDFFIWIQILFPNEHAIGDYLVRLHAQELWPQLHTILNTMLHRPAVYRTLSSISWLETDTDHNKKIFIGQHQTAQQPQRSLFFLY